MTTARPDALRELEREVGVLIRRVRRVIGERARLVHPDLQSSSYLMLGYVVDHGPLRASAMSTIFDVDKGAISRQVQHLVDLGLVDRTPDPDDGRATLISVSDEGARRFRDVTEHRRKWFDERLGDWTADEILAFAGTMHRYNQALGADESWA
ncbi:MarR family transcriptional regulator [Nocardioides silvaticus]|uniref:MarR family transcriptional regulator n=1 Tax=Nocardioides silvaticus TaxID=2201891 RepID=A0A316TCF8_9ACTN|nr:MarR family transcriptional regulator [Nocardioides silvaticus]PWN02053.1 MarR family transcriptional regulator [Nocardioides silvaticus]